MQKTLLQIAGALLSIQLPLSAQTTQGLISGRVGDAYTGASVPGAHISFINAETGAAGQAQSDSAGRYVLPLLSPGNYRVRAAAARYQAQEVHELRVAVAGRVDIGFRLRPLSDVWEAGQYRTVIPPDTEAVITFYGPDVDSSRSGSFEAVRGQSGRLESTVSTVIDRRQLRDLPLAGRDAYTFLITQPGVTADSGTTRGLGISVNGQRPSASNYLLDGLEHNNYLVTGPLTIVAPEALEEYRVSTNNFSAEYGRTSGFLANAITRTGTNRWHGLGYYYLKNDWLNANDFQRNLAGAPPAPVRESQPGLFVGGPLRRNLLFVSAAFEYLRFRSREAPRGIQLPTTLFGTAPNSLARQVLQTFPAPAVTSGDLPVASVTVAPPSRLDLDRYLLVPRVDYVPSSGKERISGRVSVSRLNRPNFLWTPYSDFISPLRDNAVSAAVTATSSLSARFTNEARAAFNRDNLEFDRAHPEVPTLATSDGTILPGSPALYGFQNHTKTFEAVDNLLWAKGAHTWKFGSGILVRSVSGTLNAGQGGFYGFIDAPVSFATDRPEIFITSLSRTALANGSLTVPAFDRDYRNVQFFGFIQDSFRITPQLVLNYGVRYENFGAPVNVGSTRDAMVQLGTGNSLGQRIASARLTMPQSGSEEMYDADKNNWAARLGFSFNPGRTARTVVRGSYGIFYDRPFDNLWLNLRNNDVDLRRFDLTGRINYLRPVSDVVASLAVPGSTSFSELTMYQPGIRDGCVQSYFLGVQQQVTDNLTLEVNGLGSFGRKLITTDSINRPLSVPAGGSGNPNRFFNPDLGSIHYRSNQGISDYHALTVTARYRSEHAQFQVAYTWSHSVDNQSDALAGEFFNLDFTALASTGASSQRAAFARQFDSHGDRGNSDFDQRHNLVFSSVWDVPSVLQSSKLAPALRNWRVAELGAMRSGVPYTVSAPLNVSRTGESIINNRADVAAPNSAAADSNVSGGKLLLNAAAFRQPTPGTLGNSGRNAFTGPGFVNVDLSVSRSFALRQLGESGRLTFRADAFNVLNHANLNNPDSLLGSPTFGIAQYGRVERNAGFPLLVPFTETARQIQLMLRVEF